MIAFIFPGQGAQKVGMGKALAEAFPICRETFAEADAALGEPLSRLCFEGPEDALTLTENTQPAILAVSVAALRLLTSRSVRPAFVAGHSLGEYSANVAAGTLGFADALNIVRRRGRYMQEAVPVGTGAMSAVLGLDADRVAEACREALAEAVAAEIADEKARAAFIRKFTSGEVIIWSVSMLPVWDIGQFRILIQTIWESSLGCYKASPSRGPLMPCRSNRLRPPEGVTSGRCGAVRD